jgi:hypothetical protein
MFFNGLMGTVNQLSARRQMGAVTLALRTDKRNYLVGETPVYTLTAAIPGSKVYWSSFRNLEATGEFQADYGQTIGANGTAELTGGAWTDDQVGNWEKTALVIAPDGAQSLAQVFFSVSPKVTAPAPGTNPPGTTYGSFLDGSYNILGFDIPKPLAIVGGGLGAWWLLGQFGGRRR